MKHRKSVAPPLAVGAVAAAILTITGFGTYAALTAEVRVTPQEVSSGTLILGLTDTGVGFSQAVSALAPGDTVNRYVELTNTGTLAGDTLTVAVASDGDPVLIDDGTGGATTKAITLAVTSCSVAWEPTSGVCAGDSTVLQTAVPLGDLGSTISLGSGTLEPDASEFLQISLSLPDQDEVTENGSLPAVTVQGASVDLTYTFGIVQRTATTTSG